MSHPVHSTKKYYDCADGNDDEHEDGHDGDNECLPTIAMRMRSN